MRVHKLLILLLVHEVWVTWGKGTIFAAVLGHIDELLKCFEHEILHVAALCLRHRARQWKGLQVAADPHAHRELRQPQGAQVKHATGRQPLHSDK